MTETEKAVVFAILMENNDGILGKSPSYVIEKWRMVGVKSYPEYLLDNQNLAKLEAWKKKWCGEK